MTPGSWRAARSNGTAGAPWRRGAAALLAALALTAAPAFGQKAGYRGVDIFDAVCATCHVDGTEGAPRIGDRAAWATRAAQSLEVLTRNALEGVGNMPRHGGNTSLSRIQIQRAIVYMVNESGGNWVEPPDPPGQGPRRSGAQVVQAHCMLCHTTGFNGAPRIGDRAEWLPRTKLGLDPLVLAAIRGHGAMPARGGQANLTDDELRDAVIYMMSSLSTRSAADRDAKRRR